MSDSPTTTRRRILVDPRLCEAHALCIDLAPEVFELGDDIASCTETPDEKNWADVEAAVAACPRQAITVVEATVSSNNGRP
jgi:ferredoxin